MEEESMHYRRFVPFIAVTALTLALLGASPVSAGGRPFTTSLAGPSEVPPGDPDATGTATVWINPGIGTVCYSWSVSNAATPILAAHIHHAVVGVAGPVVVPLPPTGPSSGTGCTTGVDRSLALDIIRHPSDYYVNTHNAEFPAGVARGQLSRTP
ncbi:MAG: CHRD domain-containing protein [Chloroflexi bacterium]|nr:MAG: CHRD domain-containing protein [Chloroflexota bacterium]